MRLDSRSGIISFCIILVGFAFRVFYLNQHGLWYDEAFAIVYASHSFAEMLYGTLAQVSGVAADVHPLFYYYFLHLWMGLAGAGLFAARFFSVLAGVATIPLVMSIAHRLFGERVAIASGIVVAIAPFHIAYSQECRMYAQLGFWSALALYAFVRLSRTPRMRWWLTLVLAGAAALYSHNLAAFEFAALGAWAIVDAARTRATGLLRATVLAGAAMLLLWLPWLVFLPSQYGKIVQAYWVPPPTLETLIQTLLVFAFDFDNAAPPAWLLPVILFGAVLILGLTGFEIARRVRALDERANWSLGFVVVMSIGPIVLLYAISQWRSVYIIRGLIPAFLGCALLVGWMLSGMPRRAGWVAGSALGIVALLTLPAYYTYAEFPRSPFQQMVQVLQSRALPADEIVHDNKLSFFPMYYYGPALPQTFIADPPGAASDTLAYPTQQALGLYATNLDAATTNKSRIWFVIFQRAIDEAQSQGLAQSNLAWMQQHFRLVSLDRFNDLDLYTFTR